MKLLSIPLLLFFLAYIAWPYVTILRLDRALTSNDPTTLEHLIDLNAVQQEFKDRMDKGLRGAVGGENNPMLEFMTGGIRQLGGSAIEQMITIEWVRARLLSKSDRGPASTPSFLDAVGFALFESLDLFLIRLGQLGENPVHVRMRLQDWDWRIVAVYE